MKPLSNQKKKHLLSVWFLTGLLLWVLVFLPALSVNAQEPEKNKNKKTDPLFLELQEDFKEFIPYPLLFEKKGDGSSLNITIQNTDDLDEKQFVLLIFDFGQRVFSNPKTNQFLRIKFKAKYTEGVSHSATIRRRDVKNFQQKKISQAELIRRFDLLLLESLAHLKKRVFEAYEKKDQKNLLLALAKWLKKDPTNTLALKILANTYREMAFKTNNKEFYEQALGINQEIIKKNPQSLFAWQNLVFINLKLGALQDALAALSHAQKLSEENPQLMLSQAVLYRRLDKSKEAMEIVKKLKEKSPSAKVYLLEGNLLRDQNKTKEAKAAYEQALKLDNKNNRARYNLILLHLDQKNTKQALKEFKELEKKAPQLSKKLKEYEFFKNQ